MAEATPVVGIIMGSESDMPAMEPCMAQLDAMGVPYEEKVASAHRKPAVVHEWAETAHDRGIKVIIAAAGKAAHLGGVVAAFTPLPVIAVPMKTSDLGGLDSLLSMVQMPSGVPVACVAINGAKNAAILAVQMMGTNDEVMLQKVADLETGLKKRIIGQVEAVNAVAAAVRRSRIRLSAKKRPASFIFVGPTGVGKTELVKVLSEELFDNVEPLIRLDMSEFMEKHSVSRIIGSPPGYVGYDEAGQLTEKVRRRPYSIVLFDEIEKAHPDVMNILLQILDEGRITDAQGRQVSFENTIIIMTSNAGSERQGSALGFDKTRYDDAKDKAETSLRQFLRPEFLARVDEVVVFRPLTEADMEKIAVLMLEELKKGLAEREIKFGWDDGVLRLAATEAYGHKSGARDLRNVLRRRVEDPICTLLAGCPEQPPALIHAEEKDGEIVLVTA